MSAPLGHPTQDESDRPFPKKARAPGQWWARWRTTMRPWSPVLVREWHSVTDHEFERGARMVDWQGGGPTSRADDPDIEWGDPIPQPDEELPEAGILVAERRKVEAMSDGFKEAVRDLFLTAKLKGAP